MVGYGPAVTLGRSQKTWLTNCGIRADAFPSCNASIPLNPQLLEAVSSCLDESKAFKFSPAAKGGFEGSQAPCIRVKSWSKNVDFYVDGDYNNHAAIKDIYGASSVRKMECIGHIQKRVGCPLQKFKNSRSWTWRQRKVKRCFNQPAAKLL